VMRYEYEGAGAALGHLASGVGQPDGGRRDTTPHYTTRVKYYGPGEMFETPRARAHSRGRRRIEEEEDRGGGG
jgi:hypothetical protein